MKRLIIPTLLALLVAGCSSTPDTAEQTGAPVESRTSSGNVATVTAGNMDSRKLPPELTDPKSILSKRSIYFDFDQYTIRDEFKSVIEAHAKYLIANKGRKVILQGNADERGSREYNLALGQKRSEAVSKALQALGVTGSQLEAVSLGEEKPKATGTDEASFAENRRADLVYQ